MAIKFSIPNYPSFTSTAAHKGSIIFVPDIKHLIHFANGDLSPVINGVVGFSDIMNKNSIARNLSKCESIEEFEVFKRASKAILEKPDLEYLKGNKFKIKFKDISLDPSNDYSGMKALEKSVIESLFETQKPYMDIVKGMAESMIKIEDIIAVVLAVSGESLKPKGNPRALGYSKNKSLLNKSLKQMRRLRNFSKENLYINEPIDEEEDERVSNPTTEEIITTEYSTGEFIKGVEYDYTYNYIKEKRLISIPEEEEDPEEEDNFPKVVVFGIYDALGRPVPEENVPTWLKESGKYYGQFDRLTNTKYKWVKKAFGKVIAEEISYDKPNKPGRWEIVKYTNGLDSKGYKKNDPVVIFSTDKTNDYDIFKGFYNHKIERGLKNITGFTESEKRIIHSEILNTVSNISEDKPSPMQTVMESLSNGGFLIGYNGRFIPLQRSSFKPKDISYMGEQMWIEPESDYDMKVIKIDSDNKVKYFDNELNREVVTEVLFFDQRTIEIYVEDILDTVNQYVTPKIDVSKNPTEPKIRKAKFDITFYKNGVVWTSYKSTDKAILFNPSVGDNWSLVISKIGKKKVSIERKLIGNYFPNDNERVSLIWERNNSDITPIYGGIGSNDSVYSVKTLRVNNVSGKVIIKDPLSAKNSLNSKSIDPALIQNKHLQISERYSKGEYGEDVNTIQQLYRHPMYAGDDQSYYLVEGILEEDIDPLNIDINGGGSGKGYYKIKHIVKAVPKFISLIIHLSTKLFPPINKLIQTLSNPNMLPNFVTTIIMDKVGDKGGKENIKFEVFSKKFFKEVNKVKASIQKEIGDSTLTLEDKMSKIDKYINKSKIKNYFYVDNDLNLKCLIDGESSIKLFGMIFGIKVKDLIPSLKIYKNTNEYSGTNLPTSSSLGLPGKPISINTLNTQDLEALKKDSVLSKDISKRINLTTIKSLDVKYSTGDFIEGVNYEYVYVNEFTANTINNAEALIDSGNIEAGVAMYMISIKEDPTNKILQDKIELAKKRLGKDFIFELGLLQPLLDLLLGMVTSPIKIIKKLIDYILDFFKSLSDPFSLPDVIPDFVSFKWVMDIFSPMGILSALGLSIDMSKLKEIIASGTGVFDLSKIAGLNFLPPMPSYDAEQFKDLNLPAILQRIKSLFQMIETIFNMFVDLIWAIMGLSPLLKNKPYLNVSSSINEDITEDEKERIINLILGVESNDFIKTDGTTPSYNFVYDIQLPDGRFVKDLNRVELDKWIEDNDDFDFKLNF